ncbi:MAG: energy transducer TonB [Balneolaceae bacterium]|nr:energy transducer TonB [Balneolaceae bacterium]
MKKLLFLYISLGFLSCELFNKEQVEKIEDGITEYPFSCEEVSDYFIVAERMPVLQGGLGELQRKVNYPDSAHQAGIEGRVQVHFVVSEKGNVLCPMVTRGIGYGCDEEALEVVSKATFNPGMQDGIPVKVEYSLPIVFRLDN